MIEVNSKPNIYNYTDIRVYIKDHYLYLKKKNANFSYNAWSKVLGVKDSTTILKVIKGERNLGPELSAKFQKYFAFTPKQAEYFSDLVTLSKIGRQSRLGGLIRSSLNQEFSTNRARTIKNTDSELINGIWPFLIKTILELKNPPKNSKEFSEMFFIKNKEHCFDRAIKALLEAKLIIKNADGSFCPCEEYMEPDEGVGFETIRRLHLQNIELTKEIIEYGPITKDNVSSNSYLVRMKKEDFFPLRRELSAFIMQLAEKYTAPTQAESEEVYQLQYQLVPLVKKSPL